MPGKRHTFVDAATAKQLVQESQSRCPTCRFWEELEGATWGENGYSVNWEGNCKRYPPMFRDFPGTNQEEFQQAVTTYIDWCGEHQKKQEAKVPSGILVTNLNGYAALATSVKNVLWRMGEDVTVEYLLTLDRIPINRLRTQENWRGLTGRKTVGAIRQLLLQNGFVPSDDCVFGPKGPAR